MEQALAVVAAAPAGHLTLVVVVLSHRSVDFHKNVVGVSGLVVGQPLVEVPDLDDLSTKFFHI
jgi:hypothetical protein